MNVFAQIVEGIVINIIIADQWFIDLQNDTYVQSESDNGVVKNIGASVGDEYDEVKDVFIRPKPFDSWSLNDNYEWESPIPKPDGYYMWNESNQSWIE